MYIYIKYIIYIYIYIYIYIFLYIFIYIFIYLYIYLYIENYYFAENLEMTQIAGGGVGSCYLCHYDAMLTKIDM